ncbi:MAG: hypothetical protein M1118_10125 [Chloroflexi bacterium]|nr:hypothetical protein [Chloroflexota bacterium]
MAVAELPSRAVALPRSSGKSVARRETTSYIAWIPLLGILIGIASLLYLAQTSAVANTGYSIQQLQVQESNWEMRNEQLSLELDKARALSVIETQAKERLLMVPATDPIYLKAAPIDAGARATTSSRGASASAPILEKTAPSNNDPFAPVRSSLSVLLDPHLRPPQR